MAQSIAALKPSLEKQFNNYLSWKSHLAIGLVVLFVSTALHLGIIYTHHRYKNLHNFLPLSHKLDNQKKQRKPIKMIENQHMEGLKNEENFQSRNQSLLIPESQVQETRELRYQEPDAPIYAHLNRRLQSRRI